MDWSNPQDAQAAAPGLPPPVWGSFLQWDARTVAQKQLIQVQTPRPGIWTLWLEYTCAQKVPITISIIQASGQSSTSRSLQMLPGQHPIMVVGQTVYVSVRGSGTATGLTEVPAFVSCALAPGPATFVPLAGTHGDVEQVTPAVAPGTTVPGDIGVTRLIHNIGPGAVNYEITPGVTSGRILANTTIDLPYTGPLILVDAGGTAPTVNLTTIKA